MEISKKRFAGILCLVMICFASLGYSIKVISSRMAGTTTVRDNLFFIIEKYDGVCVLETSNIITDKGEEHTMQAFSRGHGVNVTKIALGNVTGTLQTKTALDAVYDDPTDGQYCEGTIVEWQNAGDWAYNCTFKWTFEESVTLNASAFYIGNTTYCYAIAQFPGGPDSFINGENLTVRWIPTYNAN